MKITREKACQRLHHRVSTPLTIEVDGVAYLARDWSLGGVRLGEWSEFTHTRLGDNLACSFQLPFQGFNIAFECELEVVRLNEEGQELAAKFCGLADRQIELMSHFIEQLIRGAMVSVDDTILRIDSPVTPVSTKPDASPVEEVPVSRWPSRLVATSFFYLVLGCGVFYLLAATVYENFLSLQVQHAVAEKPVEPIISLMDGRIEQVAFIEHQPIRAGEGLFSIASPDLNQQIKQAKINLEKTKVELESLRKKHAVVVDLAQSHLTREARFLEIEIDAKQGDISLAAETLVSLYEHKEDLQVSSPAAGRIVKVLRGEGSLVSKGETIAIFEHATDPIIAAYMTSDEANLLALNDRATVTANVSGGPMSAIVVSIERLDLNMMQPDGRVMRVELILQNAPSDLPAGTPVEVAFSPAQMNRWFQPATPHISSELRSAPGRNI